MKILWPAIVIAILVVGALIYSNRSQSDATAPTAEMSQADAPTENRTTKTPSATMQTSGDYIDYSSSVIANTAGTKILFFHAPWCPQCRALEASIKSGEIPSGVTIIKVDYDTNQTLRQKYGVTIQTTLVKIDDNGGLIKKYVAYDEPTLAVLKSNLL